MSTIDSITIVNNQEHVESKVDVDPRPWRQDKNLSTLERIEKYGHLIEQALDLGEKAAIDYIRKRPHLKEDNPNLLYVFDGPILLRIQETHEEASTGKDKFGTIFGHPIDAFCSILSLGYILDLIETLEKPKEDQSQEKTCDSVPSPPEENKINKNITVPVPLPEENGDNGDQYLYYDTVYILLACLIIFLSIIHSTIGFVIICLWCFMVFVNYHNGEEKNLFDCTLTGCIFFILSILVIIVMITSIIVSPVSYLKNLSLKCEMNAHNGTNIDISWTIHDQMQDLYPIQSLSMMKFSDVSEKYGIYGKTINEKGLVDADWNRLAFVEYEPALRFPQKLKYNYHHNETVLIDTVVMICRDKFLEFCPRQLPKGKTVQVCQSTF